nr:PREDICTED: uncharacterized protein LOC105266013 [Fopius arisanus]
MYASSCIQPRLIQVLHQSDSDESHHREIHNSLKQASLSQPSLNKAHLSLKSVYIFPAWTKQACLRAVFIVSLAFSHLGRCNTPQKLEDREKDEAVRQTVVMSCPGGEPERSNEDPECPELEDSLSTKVAGLPPVVAVIEDKLEVPASILFNSHAKRSEEPLGSPIKTEGFIDKEASLKDENEAIRPTSASIIEKGQISGEIMDKNVEERAASTQPLVDNARDNGLQDDKQKIIGIDSSPPPATPQLPQIVVVTPSPSMQLSHGFKNKIHIKSESTIPAGSSKTAHLHSPLAHEAKKKPNCPGQIHTTIPVLSGKVLAKPGKQPAKASKDVYDLSDEEEENIFRKKHPKKTPPPAKKTATSPTKTQMMAVLQNIAERLGNTATENNSSLVRLIS